METDRSTQQAPKEWAHLDWGRGPLLGGLLALLGRDPRLPLRIPVICRDTTEGNLETVHD